MPSRLSKASSFCHDMRRNAQNMSVVWERHGSSRSLLFLALLVRVVSQLAICTFQVGTSNSPTRVRLVRCTFWLPPKKPKTLGLCVLWVLRKTWQTHLDYSDSFDSSQMIFHISQVMWLEWHLLTVTLFTCPKGLTTEIGFLSLYPRLRDSPLGAGGESCNLGKRL